MNNKIVVGLLVLLVGVGAGWYFLQGGKPAPETTTPPIIEPTIGSELPATGSAGGSEGDKGIERPAVVYTDTGFAPKTVTVKKGTNITFINNSSKGMWVASAMHPTHQLLPGFDELKSVSAGGTYEYMFEKVGTWKYHNHVAPADIGTVVVTE